jgi:hypothetical protein
MKPHFQTPLEVRQLDAKNWELTAPLIFYSPTLERSVVVPTGFVTDFASVPRWPFIYWFTGGTAEAPAVLHDYFYRTNTEDLTRAGADALLAEAMDSVGYWKIRTWMMWAGVRIGGYWSYDTRSTTGETDG